MFSLANLLYILNRTYYITYYSNDIERPNHGEKRWVNYGIWQLWNVN